MKKNRVLSIILSLFIILGGSRTVFAQTKAILYKYPNVGTFTCECEEKNWGDSCRHKYYEYAGDYLLEITFRGYYEPAQKFEMRLEGCHTNMAHHSGYSLVDERKYILPNVTGARLQEHNNAGSQHAGEVTVPQEGIIIIPFTLCQEDCGFSTEDGNWYCNSVTDPNAFVRVIPDYSKSIVNESVISEEKLYLKDAVPIEQREEIRTRIDEEFNTLKMDDYRLKTIFQVGSTNYIADGETEPLITTYELNNFSTTDTEQFLKPYLKNGELMVPLKYIAEALNYEIKAGYAKLYDGISQAEGIYLMSTYRKNGDNFLNELDLSYRTKVLTKSSKVNSSKEVTTQLEKNILQEYKGNVLYISANRFAKALGASVTWDKENQTLTIQNHNIWKDINKRAFETLYTTKWQAGQASYTKNGHPLSLKSAPYVEKGKLMVPGQEFGEVLGYTSQFIAGDTLEFYDQNGVNRVNAGIGLKQIGNPVDDLMAINATCIKNGVIYVEAEALAKSLNAVTIWDAASKTLTVEKIDTILHQIY
ncbi:MAG: hypothetical protein KID02_15385 [Clostridiales bacterium]|nr:hypothetical protein [Clostridiales bacterium]